MKPPAAPGAKRGVQAHWSRIRKTRLIPSAPMSRAAELEAIAQFEEERGVTSCERVDKVPADPKLHAPSKGNPMPGWR